jgi:hypothetical protein
MVEIKCPPRDLDVNDRINILFDNISRYISSEEFQELVLLFGGIDYSNLSLKEKIDYLSEFVKVWDYRNNRERWAIRNDEFIEQNKTKIMQLLERLNLVHPRPLENKPNYILILGGARNNNFYRPGKAKTIYDICEEKPIVVGLTCDREISKLEKDCYLKYGDRIKTEADAISVGIEESFDVRVKSRRDNIVDFGNNIYMISARNYPDGRRANTYDTFKEFINIFNIKDQNILLVTNQPYTSYQLLKFMDFAFNNNLFIEAIGCDNDSTLQESNYLQELKSNIDAIKVLSEKYLMEISHER